MPETTNAPVRSLSITQEADGLYTVRSGDHYNDQLGADEALYAIAQWLINKTADALWSEEQHRRWNEVYAPRPPLEPWQKQLSACQDDGPISQEQGRTIKRRVSGN